MIIYRLVAEEFSSKRDIISGFGAHRDGGRWNPKKLRTVYCATDVKTCASEKGHYVITRDVELLLFRQQNSKSKNPKIWKNVINRPFALASISIDDNTLSNLNIANQDTLSDCLNHFEMPTHFTTQDYRKSPYDKLPHNWTQTLGETLYNESGPQLTALSARSSTGNVIALFTGLLKPQDIDIKIEPAFLSAVNQNGEQIKVGNTPVLGKVYFESKVHSFTTEIKHFPI